jgi:glycosyltransferase involved in cell wall biosynthesis
VCTVVSETLVSVVTPFHNTAPYLARCIESVLAQSCAQFEYILVDNCSTDGSGEIAAGYARRDPRIRMIRRESLLPQVQNYNAALAEISAASRYCKIVQADDYIFPECLRLMVQAFEPSESIGLVSSYWLKGDAVLGSGFPNGVTQLPGRELARRYLRHGLYVFGSPTTVMYRSSLVREHAPFYQEGLLHEDTEKCMQILGKWDFGFVHQILSFLRVGNESITSAVRSLQPNALDRYILVQRYAAAFLEPDEAARIQGLSRRAYYRVLADAAIRMRGPEFWRYHEQGLKTLGESLNRSRLALSVGLELLRMAANPGETVSGLAGYWKRRESRGEVATAPAPDKREGRNARVLSAEARARQGEMPPGERAGK